MIHQLGPYRIERVLGRGGMGTVYVGVEQESGKRAAIKVLAPGLADDEGFRARFAAEIEALIKLKHPHIVDVYAYGEQEGLLFYAMEWVEGTSLQEELAAGCRFDWREACRMAMQVCSALKHAHDHGIIHRDLKPANLLLNAENQVKLTDFGIARLFGQRPLTVAGGVVGTADFMAPEQAEGKPAEVRSDLYSLGCVLYTLLAGRPPFCGRSLAEVIHMVCYDPPLPVRRLVPDVPAELESILEQLLHKRPEQRVPTALALYNRLQSVERSLPPRIAEAEPGPGGEPDGLGVTNRSQAASEPGFGRGEATVASSAYGLGNRMAPLANAPAPSQSSPSAESASPGSVLGMPTEVDPSSPPGAGPAKASPRRLPTRRSISSPSIRSGAGKRHSG